MNPNTNEPDADDLQHVANPLGVMQPGERVICEIKRHPVGLMGVYIAAGFVVILALAAAVGVPYLLPDSTSQVRLGVVLGALLVIVIALLYSYIAAVVYKANRWVVTSDSITEITQVGLFGKQTSQLSLANLEDVAVEQDGLMQSLLGFGNLRCETAGSRSRFVFPYCPNPNECARRIIAAHESYIADHPEGTYTTNRALANAHGFNQPSDDGHTTQQ